MTFSPMPMLCTCSALVYLSGRIYVDLDRLRLQHLRLQRCFHQFSCHRSRWTRCKDNRCMSRLLGRQVHRQAVRLRVKRVVQTHDSRKRGNMKNKSLTSSFLCGSLQQFSPILLNCHVGPGAWAWATGRGTDAALWPTSIWRWPRCRGFTGNEPRTIHETLAWGWGKVRENPMPYLPEENKPNAALVFHASNQCGIMGDLLEEKCRESKWDIVGRFWDKCGSYGNGIREIAIPMDGIPPENGFCEIGHTTCNGTMQNDIHFLGFWMILGWFLLGFAAKYDFPEVGPWDNKFSCAPSHFHPVRLFLRCTELLRSSWPRWTSGWSTSKISKHTWNSEVTQRDCRSHPMHRRNPNLPTLPKNCRLQPPGNFCVDDVRTRSAKRARNI